MASVHNSLEEKEVLRNLQSWRSYHSLGSPSLGPALTILPTSPANVTPLLARCSWEPVLLGGRCLGLQALSPSIFRRRRELLHMEPSGIRRKMPLCPSCWWAASRPAHMGRWAGGPPCAVLPGASGRASLSRASETGRAWSPPPHRVRTCLVDLRPHPFL